MRALVEKDMAKNIENSLTLLEGSIWDGTGIIFRNLLNNLLSTSVLSKILTYLSKTLRLCPVEISRIFTIISFTKQMRSVF